MKKAKDKTFELSLKTINLYQRNILSNDANKKLDELLKAICCYVNTFNQELSLDILIQEALLWSYLKPFPHHDLDQGSVMQFDSEWVVLEPSSNESQAFYFHDYEDVEIVYSKEEWSNPHSERVFQLSFSPSLKMHL